MRNFRQAFWGGFAGKIVAAIFIAACIAMGVGPLEWVAWFISGLSFVTPEMARLAFLILAALVIVVSAVGWWRNASSSLAHPFAEWPFSRQKEPPGTIKHPEVRREKLIPLQEAARIAYEETQELLAGYVARSSRLIGNDKLLGFYALLLVGDEELPMYGTRPHSNKIIKIPDGNPDMVSDDGKTLIDQFSQEVTFEKVYVPKSGFQKKVKTLPGMLSE